MQNSLAGVVCLHCAWEQVLADTALGDDAGSQGQPGALKQITTAQSSSAAVAEAHASCAKQAAMFMSLAATPLKASCRAKQAACAALQASSGTAWRPVLSIKVQQQCMLHAELSF